jgi:farnesyl diphosphate synthase
MNWNELFSAFSAYYPRALTVIDAHLDPTLSPSVRQHCLDLIRYSTTGGKHARGLVTSSTFFEQTGVSLTSPQAEAGFLLGWAIETLQAAYLVADDLMDQSETRRGQKCWYLLPDVGNYAALDAMLVENCAFELLEETRHFLPDIVVDKIVDAFRRTNILTTAGQTFDFLARSHTFPCYDILVNNKTSFSTISLPVIVGMLAAQRVPEEEIHSSSLLQLLLDMGHYFQVEDDWLDVYGDPAVTGKIGTDLKSVKVTWISCGNEIVR